MYCFLHSEACSTRKIMYAISFFWTELPFSKLSVSWALILQDPVVQKVDSAIRWINLYPVDNAIGFPNTYPQDSDLSGG